MGLGEMLKSVLYGIVEGISEWLPISSTGHMILLEKFVKMNVSEAFFEMFLVVIQLGAILAVLMIYWNKLMPFRFKGGFSVKEGSMPMWGKIIVSCLPAAVVGIPLDDFIDKHFYNYIVVSIALILFGVLFILIENRNKNIKPRVLSIATLTYRDAVIIGIFQLIAALFPGTSRSGATILGAIFIGVSRTVAAEYTFFLAVPVMFGASFIKLLKFGFDFTKSEVLLLAGGMLTAFIVSVLAIQFLMGYIKKHDFKPFGWYRIALGALVLLIFAV